MANRLSQEKANAIAAEYLTNGYQKVKALLSVGYKTTYANSAVGLRLYDNDMVKQAMSKIQAASKSKTDITVASIQSELEQVQADAKAKGDIQGQLRALELKGKTIAAYSDNLNTNDLTQQVALEAIDKLEAERIANIRLSQAV